MLLQKIRVFPLPFSHESYCLSLMNACPSYSLVSCSSQRFLYRNWTLGGSFSRKPSQDLFLHYHESKEADPFLDPEIFPQLFKAFARFKLAKEGASVHTDAVKMGFDSYTSIANSLISFYMKVGMVDSASNMFDEMRRKDSVSWNAVIHGFLSNGVSEFGLGLFKEARVFGFVPNLSTLVLVLQACWKLKASSEGKNLHGYMTKSGVSADVSVQNSLLTFYVKFQDIESSQKLFDEMPERDVISWSSLISGFAQSGEAVAAFKLFRKMSMENGIIIDGLALISVLKACSVFRDLNHGRSIHGHIIRLGFEADLFIGNSLIDVYSKCHDVNSAYMAFSQVQQTNLVSWNSILSGLVENEKHIEAILLFESMKEEGIEADAYTAVILLQSSKKIGQEAYCRSIHSLAVRKLFEFNDFVLNSLLDAYVKCGLMDYALKLFDQMPSRDVISWSTMILGFGHCGDAENAVTFFEQMRLVGEAVPNSITMLSLLEACSVVADLKLLKCVHGLTKANGLSKDLSVGTSLLDTYAKCGDLGSSKKVFEEMSEKNIIAWNALIGSFGMNGHAREAIVALQLMEMQNVKPNGVTMLSILSACSHGGLVKEGLLLFQRMIEDLLLEPSMEHYSCIVDMLARAGNLKGGLEVIKRMIEEGVEAGSAAWGALLSACRKFDDLELGRCAGLRVLELEPQRSAGYVLSSSLYAKEGLQEEMARLRLMMRERKVRVVSGYSLVHVGHHTCRFFAWDESHRRTEEIYCMVENLHDYMQWCNENASFEERICGSVSFKVELRYINTGPKSFFQYSPFRNFSTRSSPE